MLFNTTLDEVIGQWRAINDGTGIPKTNVGDKDNRS